jgi:nuclease HARBI1
MFLNIYEEIRADLSFSVRSSAIDPTRKLAIALRFYAVGSYQQCVGNQVLLSTSQSAVSKIIAEVTTILERKICPIWIKFPITNEEKLSLKSEFYNKYGFPGVIGAIDGTHVAMIAPREAENVFVNRKGYHSINVQLVKIEKKCNRKNIIRLDFSDMRCKHVHT